MKLRILYLSICIGVLAAIVHISVVLLVPYYGQKDAARYIMDNSSFGQFSQSRRDGSPILPDGDPFFDLATCKFDLDRSAVLVTGEETKLYWSASVFNERGRIVYSLNRRSAIKNQLRMLVVNPVQMARIRQFQPDELETAIVIETTEQTGFIMIRMLRREDSMKPLIQDFLDGLNCQDYAISDQAPE